MIDLKKFEVWFVTGSQHLYGPETLEKVAEHSREIAGGLDATPQMPVRVVFKPVLTTADAVHELCREANNAAHCIGLVTWMHTFSPAKMWIAGLKALQKPFLHLHTQYNRELPWATIDMDFMNLNQAAHGDREFGFIGSRMRLDRKVVVGFWQDLEVISELGTWARAAAGWHDAQHLKVARFGDNMRNVAVTEGDKVQAKIQLAYSVDGFGVGDLVARIHAASDRDVDHLVSEYEDTYTLSEPLTAKGKQRASLLDAARIELGLRHFLKDGNFHAFTDTFEDLHGLNQLPGIAVQRLMADGYGFGAEGDWKTAALVRTMKVMAAGLDAGTSFMEDYTYHLENGGLVLGAHMLEICPSIASGKPSCEIHPLSIGGKGDPVRLVFDSQTGPAVVATIVDVGERFRMVINKVNVIPPEVPLPKLPVARAVWIPEPNLAVAAACWIYAGGAHHTGFSLCLTAQHLQDYAEMAGIECVLIDNDTTVHACKNELRWNDAYYRLTGWR
ncbi:L-arabinose isomerase [Candidatus Koribacter versatilis Ellin345]|uniref:L-arabinose isomerase n=1 Tax=Koribacter versatilis (strain Ellin345) TaxID=204669 RepID=ARAA_KORVE|nr:L-arabinose isomerase [Candidatus Koribacter versatilis]Q1IUW9.1 RecName: Full=L-arabinose isomerase [Candidatus Koribacter versatilis Ellin345]ABF39331.1 L-arabinose isomerase [Candidatus Koribacter versatilis Ellin345]